MLIKVSDSVMAFEMWIKYFLRGRIFSTIIVVVYYWGFSFLWTTTSCLLDLVYYYKLSRFNQCNKLVMNCSRLQVCTRFNKFNFYSVVSRHLFVLFNYKLIKIVNLFNFVACWPSNNNRYLIRWISWLQ